MPQIGGNGIWTLVPPSDPALLGAAVYLQAAVTSPGTNLLGAITSNGCQLTLGAR